VESLVQGLRFGARAFLRHRTFALAAVLTLGLGVGATTALFSVLDAVVLKPLPYEAPERLITLWETNRVEGLDHEPLSPVNFMDYLELDVFEDLAPGGPPQVVLKEGDGEPIRAATIEASRNFFSVLRAQPFLGRAFEPGDKLFSTESEAVISYRLWQGRFGDVPTSSDRPST
jgi:hypothetical protein